MEKLFEETLSNSGTHTRLDVEGVVGAQDFEVAMVVATVLRKKRLISYKFYETRDSNLPVLDQGSTLYIRLNN